MKGAYECDQCWKAYNTEDLLQRHIRKIHVGPRWRCPDCEYSADYSDRPGLRRHLQLDHHYTKEQAMDMQFEQVKPRKRGSHTVSSGGGGNYNGGGGGSYSNKRGRSPTENPPRWTEQDRGKTRSESLSPRHSTVSDATSTMTTDDRHNHTLRSVVSAVPSSTQTAPAAAASSMPTPLIIPDTLPYPSQVIAGLFVFLFLY